MIPNLNLIRLFRSVAVRGGVKRAMVDLHITQSAISQGLTQLERELGVVLAIRSRSEFRLTPAGERFLASCERILAELDAVESEIHPQGALPAGEFIIGCDFTMAEAYFLPRILELRKKYPKLILHLDAQISTENLFASLSTGAADLICINNAFIPKNADVLATFMPFASPVYLWASAAYLKNHKIKSSEDFKDLTFIDRSKSLPLYHYFFERTGHPAPSFKNYIAVSMMMPDAVKQGLGVTIGPKYWLEKDLKKGKIKLVLPEKYKINRQDALCINRHGMRNPVIYYLWKALSANKMQDVSFKTKLNSK